MRARQTAASAPSRTPTPEPVAPPAAPGTYQTSFPLGRERLVTIVNVPVDLTSAEAERLAAFVRMLPAEA